MPPAIKNIIFVNAIIFIMQSINQSLGAVIERQFALIPYDIIYNFKMFIPVRYWYFLCPYSIVESVACIG